MVDRFTVKYQPRGQATKSPERVPKVLKKLYSEAVGYLDYLTHERVKHPMPASMT
jgi:hypothetical protein